MQIKRLSGLGGNILTSNTLQIVELEGSNIDSPGFGSMYINNNQVPSVNSNSGLFVVVMDEFLNVLETRRFTLTSNAASGRRDVDFINFVGALPPRRYYAFISNGQIGRSTTADSFFRDVLNSNAWDDMWTLYNTAYSNPQTLGRLSYTAFGTTDLGITHESYYVGASESNLAVNISEYDYFMNTGYGSPVYTLESQIYGSTYTTYTVPASLINSNGVYITTRYRDSIQADDISIEKVYNNNSVDTYNIADANINLFKSIFLRLTHNSNVSEYRIKVKNVELLFLDLYRSSPNSISNPVSSVSKRGDGLSVKSLVFSMNGYDFEDSNHLTNFSNLAPIYTLNNSVQVNGVSMNSFALSGTQESDFIAVNKDMDYFVSFFGRNNTSNLTSATIAIKTYDSSYNPVASVSLTNLTSTEVHNMGSISNNTQNIFYQEYYVLSSKQSTSDVTNASYLVSDIYGSVTSGGWSSEVNTVNDIIIMNDDVAYIKVEITTDNSLEIINPVCDIVKFSLTKDSKYIGNINES